MPAASAKMRSVEHLGDQAVGERLVVVRLGADEEQRAAADRADDALADRDPRLGDALHERDHCDVLDGVELRLDVRRQQLDRRAQPGDLAPSAPARLRRAARRRGRASSSPARACARRGSGGCRRAASPCRRSGPSSGRSAPGCDRCCACTSGSTALSIRPSIEPQTTRAPSRMMFAATPMATHRVEPEPAGDLDQDHADDDAGRRPDVGVEVARVGFERDRAVLARRGQHLAARAGRSGPSSTTVSARPMPTPSSGCRFDEALRSPPRRWRSPPRRSSGPRRRSRSTRPWCGRTDGRRRRAARRSSPSPARTAPTPG